MFKHATLNRAYRLVWSELRNTWIAVAEFAGARGKRASGVVAIGAVLALGAGVATAAGESAPTALPTNGQVVAGQVGISSSGARMDVTQGSSSAIVNWDSFNIGSQAHVNFAQPDASSVILNRVLGGDGSAIFGRMTANGHVFITNPGGILFAPGAQVDVGGLVASSLGISDANFLAGKFQFERVGAGGTVVNQGRLTAANGGFVALIAPQVANSGSITAAGGSVGLAAGESVNLDFDHDGLLSFQVDVAAAAARADNSGVIVADGGRVVMNAQAKDALLSTVLNNDGVIRARSLESRNGEIWLGGGNSGVVSVTGTLDASGTEASQAGGTVKVLGDKVGLFAQAKIDVSGVGAGGTALVGGNFQGKGPEHNANQTYVGRGAIINADAVGTGNGGKVILWSDYTTQAFGSVSARGGLNSGNGGFVEISGKHNLVFNAHVDTRAPSGLAGMLLLDPDSIDIQNTVPTDVDSNGALNLGDGSSGDGIYADNGNPDVFRNSDTLSHFLNWSDLNSQLATTSVTVQTTTGDITVSETGSLTNGGGLTLFLNSGAALNINAGISSNVATNYRFAGAAINLGAALATKNGTVQFDNTVVLTSASIIDTVNGGVGNSVQFANTLDGTTANTETLGLTAGTGDVTFSNTVGATQALGAVTITSAADVGLTTTFQAASLT
ncbi:MAG: filamentous hemagglutinin N-terminal domain-containing protein, partial [Sulfuritalea sp.]|nr:filamentous hemagglutinin N-terminal domain-containing protein [Sulfuritalea sp.]